MPKSKKTLHPLKKALINGDPAEISSEAKKVSSNESNYLANSITGKGYKPESVIAALKALQNVDYTQLLHRTDKTEIIEFLLTQKDAKISSKAQAAYTSAAKHGITEVATVFEKHGVKVDALRIAIENKQFNTAQALLQQGHTVNKENFSKLRTTLDTRQEEQSLQHVFEMAASNSNLATIKDLFDHYICNKSLNKDSLSATQQLAIDMGEKLFCKTNDDFLPTITNTPTLNYASNARIACLLENEAAGRVDDSNCDEL